MSQLAFLSCSTTMLGLRRSSISAFQKILKSGDENYRGIRSMDQSGIGGDLSFNSMSFWNRKYTVSHSSKLFSNSNKLEKGDESAESESTWTYVPYKSPPPSRKNRNFSSSPNYPWKVPKSINIPVDQLELSFTRSSGAGGQNVNKVNTRVEVRFNVKSASWIPKEVRDRIIEQQESRMNKEGELIIYSQEHRTQGRNREECLKKLQGKENQIKV